MKLAFNLLLLLALLALTVEQFFAPTSWWLEIRKIYVPDSEVGDPAPVMAIDATIRRSFVAAYYFDIRKVGTPADLTRFTYFCSGHGEVSFQPGVGLEADADLGWWTQRTCPKFTPGSYYAQLILVWPDFLTRRSITIDSNTWTVDEAAPPAPKIIVKPVIVQQKVTKTTIIRPKCEPSIIPPRFCGQDRRRDGKPQRSVK